MLIRAEGRDSVDIRWVILLGWIYTYVDDKLVIYRDGSCFRMYNQYSRSYPMYLYPISLDI